MSRKTGNINSQRNVPMAPPSGIYKPVWQPVRPGADQHEQIPSRRAAERVWRDGRREAA